ncbi:MAG TPA: hypothetical protein VFG69_04895, partial [Nannocystaceae bacterium]|nr:hypothetical protein [Nannocystaceae bacterium]
LHWAPGLCRLPLRGGQHLSRAEGAAHDGKLFLLWAQDIDAYAKAVGWIDRAPPTEQAQITGRLGPDVAQVLVKESFAAVPFTPGDPVHGQPLHAAVRDGKPFRAGDAIGLFVMIQLASARPGTDDGWIYGTVAPDGTVTSASDVGACRDCHGARQNRLFGLPRPPALGM